MAGRWAGHFFFYGNIRIIRSLDYSSLFMLLACVYALLLLQVPKVWGC